MLLIGHRGAPDYEPENTLRSFERAIAMGVDMLEFDVFILPSGELMVFHDRTLDRTTNGSGLLVHHSFRELRKLDAGLGEKIPTLQEVLDLVDHRVPVVIEIKNAGAAGVVASVVEYYVQHKGWQYDQFIISSFDHRQLYEIKSKHLPHIKVVAPTAVIPIDGAAFAETLKAFAVTPDVEAVDQSFVNDTHRRGLEMFVYTIKTYEDTLLMHHWGVDGIFTNAPDISRQALLRGNAIGLLT